MTEPGSRTRRCAIYTRKSCEDGLEQAFAIDVDRLRGAGADLVLLPFQDAADQAVDLILRGERPPRLLVEAEQEDEKATVS